MTLHPLHYLFLDPKTYLARRIWKAAIAYCAGVQALVDNVEKRKVTPEMVEKACVACVGEMEFSMASEKLAESIRSDMRRVLEAALK